MGSRASAGSERQGGAQSALTAGQTRLARTRAQHLDGGSLDSVAAVVDAVFGVQAQRWSAAELSIRVRSASLTAADVVAAQENDRSVVLTWAMRGTLHLVPAEHVYWLLALLGPRFATGAAKRRAQLGLDDEATRRGVEVVVAALATHGPLTRVELSEHLARAGVPVAGQASVHVMHYAALQAKVCRGLDAGGDPRYVLLTDWIPADAAAAPREPAVELCRRYLRAFGPAVPEDFAAWSGLRVSVAREAWKALADDLDEVRVTGSRAWILRGTAPDRKGGEPTLRLLPYFDTYLMGYRNRELSLPDEHAREIIPRGGLIYPSVTVDGRAVATWRYTGGTVRVEPFVPIDRALGSQLEAEAADIGRFVGAPAKLVVVPRD